MSWLNKLPWLSLILLLLSYCLFGWYFSATIPLGRDLVLANFDRWNWSIAPESVDLVIFLGMGSAIILVCLSVTAASFLDIISGNWFKSDARAVASVLVWTFVVVLTICLFEQFVRLLVLLAAALLARIDLQRLGCNRWQTLLVLTLICFAGLSTGWLVFLWQNGAETTEALRLAGNWA
ncbi:MAG: hypothetical protein HC890_06480 [Chloroflexaceae bacterium]|nr:hypothetical protein [Chloroflexaceae bacterium]